MKLRGEKSQLEDEKKKTRVNSVSMLNSQFWSWVWDDFIRSKLKNNYDTQSSINLMLNDGIEIKKIYKLKKKGMMELKLKNYIN
jgi:hypothetical protein